MTVYRFGNDYLLQRQFNTGQSSEETSKFRIDGKVRFRVV